MNTHSETYQKYLVISHHNCLDGFGAAYVFRHWAIKNNFIDQVEFHFADYNGPRRIAPLEKAKDALVYILDYSYDVETTKQIASVAKWVVIIDHHKTAKETLENDEILNLPNVGLKFDMDRSGVGLTWDYLFGKEYRQEWVNLIEDRDIWKWEYPESKAFNAALFSLEYDFKVWDEYFDKSLSEILIEGEAIQRKQSKDIKDLIAAAESRMLVDGHIVPSLNAPYSYASEAGNILSVGFPFAVVWCDMNNGRKYSLRSQEDGMDVAVIAQKFGGGGHAHAASFVIPHKRSIDLQLVIE